MSKLRPLLLLFLFLQADSAAAKWWVTRFEIFDGFPLTTSNRTLTELTQAVDGALDVPWKAAKPMPDATKREIEAYLREVALFLESAGFRQPAYDPPVTGVSGGDVYRVYYHDFSDVENCKGDSVANAIAARYSNPLGGARGYIEINAKKFASSGTLSAKNYADLAHELFHAAQAATQAAQRAGGNLGEWIIEGQAEAFGHDMARKLRGVSYDYQPHRWGLRRYNQTLYAVDDSSCDSPQADGRQQAYQTSSLWRYLAERHYLRQQPVSREASMPGPDLPGGYDTDYGYLVSYMAKPVAGNGAGPELDWLDARLRTHLKQGLRPTLSEFLGVYAEYGRYRLKGPQPATEREWLADALTQDAARKPKDCTYARVDDQALRDSWVSVKLADNAAACVELDVGSTDGPKDWILQSVAGSASLARQLAMVLGGGQQSITSAPIDSGVEANPPASWVFTLEPERRHILVITNMADEPSRSSAQEIQLRITLDGHDGLQPERPPPKPRARPGSGEVAPGPRGAEDARARRRSELEPGTDGLGSAGWRHEPGGDCGNGWRFYCVGGAVISLGVTPGGGHYALSPDAMGGMFTEILDVGNLDVGYMMRWEEYLDETAGTAIELTVPGVDYGFTGTVSDAMITLPGNLTTATRSAMSARPESKWSPCSYGPPRGSVTILEFSRTLIRGRYEARLRERPRLRPGYRERCPKLPVAQTVSGEFTLAAPWHYDDRHEPDYSWIEEDVVGGVRRMLPEGMTMPPVDKAMESATPGTGGGEGSGGSGGSGGSDPIQTLEEIKPENCDCSCSALRRARDTAESMMDGGFNPLDQALMGPMLCLQVCALQGVVCD